MATNHASQWTQHPGRLLGRTRPSGTAEGPQPLLLAGSVSADTRVGSRGWQGLLRSVSTRQIIRGCPPAQLSSTGGPWLRSPLATFADTRLGRQRLSLLR